ncbi:MAG: polyhydroxyalkanoate synthesis repressor PhaR [Acidiferrobacteraceae bacterium]|jgi:polyhydroxyalkanoate synthesis repressor PhaR|nr:polyhydroxyalkanoate synthesis repressor PhaR [Acidiferrobacteraceae bacterium]MDP6435310.1 polyhydroxyalkanoate synthesis repressor PhaR [Arenicellales bacterium]MDP6673111.1 polyhydroxyalkanoate synthesis repressor PhaR [Arenicellales bacterium]MDP6725299.1 polyhydroxyalkanoate synthesis repressor PhaR [Arenicellales bacterium]|tara:strand:+ start:9149 stop:9610 length:462 start_codon:yes stop_codon:yes gene_type:complete
MAEELLIKKYPNRRLYDTSSSRYITLEEIREMVVGGTPFRVVEKKTNEDITRNTLLQIIMEHESGDGEPMFSIDLLIRFIRNYGENTQDSFKSYMEQSMEFFSQQQGVLSEQLSKSATGNPSELLMDMGKKQLDVWQQTQKQFFDAMTGKPKK